MIVILDGYIWNIFGGSVSLTTYTKRQASALITYIPRLNIIKVITETIWGLRMLYVLNLATLSQVS